MSVKKSPGLVSVPKSEKGILQKFLESRQMKLGAEAAVKLLQPLVEKIVRSSPGKCIQFGVSTLKLSPVSGGKKFNVEKATKKLGKQELEPFWKSIRVFDIEAATEALGEENLEAFWEEQPGYERLHVS